MRYNCNIVTGPNDKFNLIEKGHQGVVIEASSDVGKTIIFYDISDEFPPYGLEDEVEKPERALRKSFKKATENIEEVANIEFFDINHLSRKDRKYLKSQNIEVPDEPHIVLERNSRRKMGINLGTAQMPGTLMLDDSIEYINIRDDIKRKTDNYYRNFDGVVMHETLHSLGLKHPYEVQNFPKEYDNVYNTRTSYNVAGDQGGLGAIDIYSLREEYGENPEYNFNFSEESLKKDVDPILGQKYDSVENMVKNSPNIDRRERKRFYDLKAELEKDGLSKQDMNSLKEFAQIVESSNSRVEDKYKKSHEVKGKIEFQR